MSLENQAGDRASSDFRIPHPDHQQTEGTKSTISRLLCSSLVSFVQNQSAGCCVPSSSPDNKINSEIIVRCDDSVTLVPYVNYTNSSTTWVFDRHIYFYREKRGIHEMCVITKHLGCQGTKLKRRRFSSARDRDVSIYSLIRKTVPFDFSVSCLIICFI
jgi:hypothetical protein